MFRPRGILPLLCVFHRMARRQDKGGTPLGQNMGGTPMPRQSPGVRLHSGASPQWIFRKLHPTATGSFTLVASGCGPWVPRRLIGWVTPRTPSLSGGGGTLRLIRNCWYGW